MSQAKWFALLFFGAAVVFAITGDREFVLYDRVAKQRAREETDR